MIKELKKEIKIYKQMKEEDSIRIVELSMENMDLKKQLKQLKTENDKLIILGMDLNQSNELLRKTFFATDKSRDNWREKAENLYKILKEIKKIAQGYEDTHNQECKQLCCTEILEKLKKIER